MFQKKTRVSPAVLRSKKNERALTLWSHKRFAEVRKTPFATDTHPRLLVHNSSFGTAGLTMGLVCERIPL